jgi:carbamoyltransferase
MEKAVLGISAFYHDSAATLVQNGKIIAAAQEERFTRIKNDESFPLNAIRYCLEEAGIEANELECVVFYDKPFISLNDCSKLIMLLPPKDW